MRPSQGILRRRPPWQGVLLCLLGLVACTYQGHIDQPITIKATWYSYLAGDDIRRSCVPGALPRYRLVYNGSYQEQVRSYEVIGLDGGGARLVARVVGPMRPSAVIRNPADLQDPWRWTKSEALLTPQEFADFEAVLDDSGLRQRRDGTTDFLSTEFYWIVSGCEAGEFLFNAWRFGTERYAALRFPQALLGYDETGIELNPPRPVSPLDRMVEKRNVFRVRVGPNGLVDMGPYL